MQPTRLAQGGDERLGLAVGQGAEDQVEPIEGVACVSS